MNNLKKILFMTFLTFVLIDTALTYLAVFYFKVALEFNPFVVFLWHNFGVFCGEFIRLSIVLFIFALIDNRINSKNKKRRLVAWILLWFVNIAWFLVVLSNAYQLFKRP